MAAAAEYDFPRLFTAAEAQRTLPLVRTIVRDILALGAQAREVLSGRAAEPSVDELHDQLQDLLAELSGMGLLLQGLELPVRPGRLSGADRR